MNLFILMGVKWGSQTVLPHDRVRIVSWEGTHQGLFARPRLYLDLQNSNTGRRVCTTGCKSRLSKSVHYWM